MMNKSVFALSVLVAVGLTAMNTVSWAEDAYTKEVVTTTYTTQINVAVGVSHTVLMRLHGWG